MSKDLEQARRVLDVEAQSILAAKSKLDERFTKAVDLIVAAVGGGGKVVVTGVGKSGKIAAKIAATMSSTGTPAVYLHPTEGIHGDLGVVSPRDVLLALSYSGNSEEVIRLIPSLHARGAKIVSIVGNLKSQLASSSDITLDGSVDREACPLNLAPTASTTVALALGDALAMALSVRFDFKEEHFAGNHPGGALGKRLSLKVSDLMKKAADVSWLSDDASCDEVVKALTDKKLGAVLVGSSGKLSGIVTDGDIRRSLSHREKLFTMKARDIMTKNPVTVKESEQAIKALELMENRPSQISVLPVVDAKGACVGLVRLHDLIGSV